MNTAATQLDFALAHLGVVEYDLEKSNDPNLNYISETIVRLRRLKDEFSHNARASKTNASIKRRLAK